MLCPKSRPTSPTRAEPPMASVASSASVASCPQTMGGGQPRREHSGIWKEEHAPVYPPSGETVQQSADTPSSCERAAASAGSSNQLRCAWASKRLKFPMSSETLPSTCYSCLGLLYLHLMLFAHEAQRKEIHRGRDAQDLRPSVPRSPSSSRNGSTAGCYRAQRRGGATAPSSSRPPNVTGILHMGHAHGRHHPGHLHSL